MANWSPLLVKTWEGIVSETQYNVNFTLYVHANSKHEHQSNYDRPSRVSSPAGTTNFSPTWNTTLSAGQNKSVGSSAHGFPRYNYAYNVTLDGYIYRTNNGSSGHSYAYATIPARSSYTISYNANTGTGTTPSQTKYYGYNINLQSNSFTKEGFKFVGWNTQADGSGASYSAGQEYTGNGNVTLYAIWSPDNPPTGDVTEMYISDESAIKNFSEVAVDVSNIVSPVGRDFKKAEFKLGEQTFTKVGTTAEDLEGTYTIVPTQEGELSGSFTIYDAITEDESAFTTYPLGSVVVENPLWSVAPEFEDSEILAPDILSDGFGDVSLEAMKYVDGEETDFELLDGKYKITKKENSWVVDLSVGEDYVDDVFSETPQTKFRIHEAVHAETTEKEWSTAFFSTTRNMHYTNGIYNIMFASGSSVADYTSRVWYSAVNNPLYFPDTNYTEVGANDTQVMGLTKVGDYLGVVKQSKTTDTAIYLLYATSFDDDTTFAVKQGVQGVGAMGKYTFNVVGDETLFLSPDGVMAITPNQDDEHKVQNRSFFVDGKLLKEYTADVGYSFVWEGMYILGFNNRVYVLDANQRSSWGNDRTNLVYECYYLENVPASCFMQYNDELWFSNETEVCRFKKEGDINAYIDSYDVETLEENVPVKAEWSTVLDDDGTLSYYKTMQKKGAVVSLLPETLSPNGTRVFVKKDTDEPVEIEREFSTHEGIPNEVYINKKFKKYRRLQFIVRNEEAEPMGINSIVKMYTVGNYAKGR